MITQIALIQLMSHSYLYRRHCHAVCGRADRVNDMGIFGHVAREEKRGLWVYALNESIFYFERKNYGAYVLFFVSLHFACTVPT